MHRTVTATLAGCAIALAFATPQPASATTTAPALHYGEPDTGLIEQVGKKNKKKWKHRDDDIYVYRHGPRYPRYPRYAYDYDDYDYYEYRRRPGVNLHLDF